MNVRVSQLTSLADKNCFAPSRMRKFKARYLSARACALTDQAAFFPTECATRWQQEGDVVWSGFTSNFSPSACLPAISLPFIAAHTPTTKDGLAPFHATGTSRCVYQGSGPLARSACSETYGSFSLLNL